MIRWWCSFLIPRTHLFTFTQHPLALPGLSSVGPTRPSSSRCLCHHSRPNMFNPAILLAYFFFFFSLFFLISRLLTLVLPPLSRRREHVSRKLDTPFVFLNWNPLYIYICMEECAPGSRWLPPHRRHHHHHYHRQQHLYPSHPPVCLLYRYNPTQNFLIPSFSQ